MNEPVKIKKLINRPDDVIDELIDGMIGAHPELLCRHGATGRAIVSLHGPRDGKVGIVIGGGSGHEPAFSGYVGKGLADAAAVGNVFASPSPEQIMDAARAADGGAGVLFLYGNYTGDVMNFDMAGEALAGEGITARSLTVTDDVASSPIRAERRGIAGGFFVFKCAGAAADLGLSMTEVERLAGHANAMTRSAGVALGACSLPQTCRPNFTIGPDQMEIGMGIHGEPGIARTRLEPADAVADQLIDLILGDIGLKDGDRVAVLVNGLGSTPLMELYIVHRRIRARLERLGVTLHQSWVGNYVTALEMAGASVTLLKLDDALQPLLDHPCHTPALQVGSVRPTSARAQVARDIASAHKPAQGVMPQRDLVATGDITPAIFRAMLVRVAEDMALNRDRLCQLDGEIGDGDHGITMDIGWRAIRADLSDPGGEGTISAMSNRAGKAFLDAVGATAGPLYATGFGEAATAVKDRQNLNEPALVAWLVGLVKGIARRGGAAPGDKTMLDAWGPAVDRAGQAQLEGKGVVECLSAACSGASEGMSATADMMARKGRAAKLGPRSIGHVDPGAASVVVILTSMRDALNDALA